MQATGTQAAAVLGERYEVVLCHAVLPYVDHPEELVGALAPLAAPGGLGVSTRAQTRADVMGRVATAGFDVVEWFGIRVCRTTCSTCLPTTCLPCCRSRPSRRGVTSIVLSVASSTSSQRVGTASGFPRGDFGCRV